jgi:hypothetical protein
MVVYPICRIVSVIYKNNTEQTNMTSTAMFRSSFPSMKDTIKKQKDNVLNETHHEHAFITPEQISHMIQHNEYVRHCVSNKKKDKNSISSLIERSLSQSECIKLGIAMERVLTDITLHATPLQNIKEKNGKDKREKDHLFLDETNKIIYYAELKSNINLDTEKSKSTYKKCLRNLDELQMHYPDYTIHWYLVGLRYLSSVDVPGTIKHKYNPIKDHLIGINEYLQCLHVPWQFTEQTYRSFLHQMVDQMFSSH